MEAWMRSNSGQISPPTPELSALERLKKLMYNVVNTLAPLFLIKSSSYSQVLTRTSISSRTSSKFGQIGLRTAELVPLSVWKNPHRLIMGEIL